MEQLGWALVGTGNIVRKFLIGLRAAQGVGKIGVVSRQRERAVSFALEHGLDQGYADLEEALSDPSIHILYIGTPHPTHKDYALRALRAGKAVLCEKPVCMNRFEMQEIRDTAYATHTFFMEAMWTRFMPAVRMAQEWMRQGQLGAVHLVQANFGFSAPFDPKSRVFDPHLGGGALLDAGIYPLSLAFLVYGGMPPEQVHTLMHLGPTQVDEQVCGELSFGAQRMAQISASIRMNTESHAWIYGEKGHICLPNFVFGRSAILNLEGKPAQTYSPDIIGNGYNYEAEEVMRCVREGRISSGMMSMEESLAILTTMDQLREQGGLRYPD